MPSVRALALAFAALSSPLMLVACRDEAPPPAEPPAAGTEAPAPSEVPRPDPSVRRFERAAPPELQGLVSGRFQPRGERAEAATGVLEIEDDAIAGRNGVSLETERIAIVRGDDQFRPGERYSNALMVGAEQPVELRRVVRPPAEDAQPADGEAAPAADATPDAPAAPPAPAEATADADDERPAPRGPGLCAEGEADFVALVSVHEGERTVVRLVGLQGRSTPAAGAEDVRACDTLEYESRR
ncbi:hypothetical protein [Luteimonas huabeiensis]|uniref:hypothetical protein n=1 Tax=Luteimonas huabeiensis TaxID=1244513 RepID=UPI00046377B2|nr:hypothetical protein [Luteimonas huabeiensis]